ncbi:hypothetical protein DFH08DRAFT_828404 [Mycena albidolilacea]|uniref:Uncharacterized protein n=1 Tax=Mycena albidolilacea TaxID=1033008 RepID=A0AAD6YWF9_9AGAR|nr:hypothetical protein DFH08DRAFT_828404 [Mycena albidolilacea]
MEPTTRDFTTAGEAMTGMSAQLLGSKQLLPALRCLGAQGNPHLPFCYWLDGGRQVGHPMHGSEVLESAQPHGERWATHSLPPITASTLYNGGDAAGEKVEVTPLKEGRLGLLNLFTDRPRRPDHKPKSSRGPYDPVFDHQNPNPVINRAASTRQATRMETAVSLSGPSGPASSSSSPPRRSSSGRPKPTKSNSSKLTKTPVATRSSVLAPLAARLGLHTPTAASIAKGVAAPAPKQAPFGGINPRMPSHMTEEGRRGPPPRSKSVLGTEEGRPVSAASVAAPGYDLSSPAGDNTALPRMSASPPLVSFSGNAQHSSTEPSEESDLGPFSTGNETEPGGVGNNESSRNTPRLEFSVD